MDTQTVIASQYRAALDMLKQAVVQCPDALWNDRSHANPFWHLAYHALFYTHLYLQPSEAEFNPWANHRNEYEFMGPLPWPPHKEPEIGEPYSKAEILEYLALIRAAVKGTVASLDLASDESGFDWLPMGKLELQFYNIRHLQQHTGELCERLGREAQIEVDWVGMRPDDTSH